LFDAAGLIDLSSQFRVMSCVNTVTCVLAVPAVKTDVFKAAPSLNSKVSDGQQPHNHAFGSSKDARDSMKVFRFSEHKFRQSSAQSNRSNHQSD
jgi:hypothetical protein